MPIQGLNDVLASKLDEMKQAGWLKGKEAIISGVIPPDGGNGRRYSLEGEGERSFLRMNSNSYLGMSFRPEVGTAEEEAVRRFGTGPGAVRFISGTWSSHTALERRLAQFHGREAAMLFSSAYATVMGILLPLITDRTAVISDALNHSCIVNGVALARPAEKHIYRHLDMGELEQRLAATSRSCARAIIVTDGIFSMRGDHAPLDRIIERHAGTTWASWKTPSWWSTIRMASGRSGRPGVAPRNAQSPARPISWLQPLARHSRERRIRRCRRDDHSISARDLSVLHLFQPDNARRGVRRAPSGRVGRRSGRACAARASARHDSALQGWIGEIRTLSEKTESRDSHAGTNRIQGSCWNGG